MNASVKQLPELKKRRLTSVQRKLPNFSTGSLGEERAAQFLKTKHFQIVDTNVRFGLHEVDIIALQTVTPPVIQHEQQIRPLAEIIQKSTLTANPLTTQILVFCEVKTRTTSFFGNPSQAVTQKKLQSMQVVAREYLRKHHWGGEYRFDVIAVLPKEIEHFENVTWW